jgi:hypothetical protein
VKAYYDRRAPECVFDGPDLAAERGGEVLFEAHWILVVRA